jgi:GNAT superfamily N-acetyltransferase
MYLVRKLIQFLLNTKPTKSAQSFLDNKGRKIWYFWDGDPINDFFVYHRGRLTGRMQFFCERDVIELGDIVIFERYQQYRNSGIGTMMFNLLVDFAREYNFIKIEGWIQPESIDKLEKLVKFYRSLGCEINGNWFVYWVEKHSHKRN